MLNAAIVKGLALIKEPKENRLSRVKLQERSSRR